MSEKEPCSEQPEAVRVYLDILRDDLHEVELLAAVRNTSSTQIFRQSIATELFFAQKLEQGYSALLKDPNGNMHEVVFRNAPDEPHDIDINELLPPED